MERPSNNRNEINRTHRAVRSGKAPIANRGVVGDEHLIAMVHRGYLRFCRQHIPRLDPDSPWWVLSKGAAGGEVISGQ